MKTWVFSDIDKKVVVVPNEGWTADKTAMDGIVTADFTAKKVTMPADWTLKVAPIMRFPELPEDGT